MVESAKRPSALDFYDLQVKRAKDFGFPEPIFINTEKLTNRTRVIYLVEVQATHIYDKIKRKTHHFYLKFSKFKKVKEEPFWVEDLLTTEAGFTINDKSSIDKLAAYIKANQALLNIDILSKDYTSVILSNDTVAIALVKKILASEKNKDVIYELFKEQYPKLDKKILTFKLVQARRTALGEFKDALEDADKRERNYWQPFLEKNQWMFGLSYLIPLNDSRIDLWDIADYLLESEDGFVDIVEIKHPHLDFWQKDANGQYKRYRNFLQPSEELKGAITQATNYIFQVEKRFSDTDWCRENKCETPVKPACTVVFGRSHDWGIKEKTAFRLLNDSLHGVTVITFDHLYDRVDRLLISLEAKP